MMIAAFEKRIYRIKYYMMMCMYTSMNKFTQDQLLRTIKNNKLNYADAVSEMCLLLLKTVNIQV